jgi:hypothetical protein
VTNSSARQLRTKLLDLLKDYEVPEKHLETLAERLEGVIAAEANAGEDVPAAAFYRIERNIPLALPTRTTAGQKRLAATHAVLREMTAGDSVLVPADQSVPAVAGRILRGRGYCCAIRAAGPDAMRIWCLAAEEDA